MDDEENLQPRNTPMGEGRSPYKELMGWGNKSAWGELLASDVGLDIPSNKWKKNPKDHILNKPLIEIGETEKRRIPIFLSEADNRPDQKDGALLLHAELKNKEQEEQNESD